MAFAGEDTFRLLWYATLAGVGRQYPASRHPNAALFRRSRWPPFLPVPTDARFGVSAMTMGSLGHRDRSHSRFARSMTWSCPPDAEGEEAQVGRWNGMSCMSAARRDRDRRHGSSTGAASEARRSDDLKRGRPVQGRHLRTSGEIGREQSRRIHPGPRCAELGDPAGTPEGLDSAWSRRPTGRGCGSSGSDRLCRRCELLTSSPAQEPEIPAWATRTARAVDMALATLRHRSPQRRSGFCLCTRWKRPSCAASARRSASEEHDTPDMKPEAGRPEPRSPGGAILARPERQGLSRVWIDDSLSPIPTSEQRMHRPSVTTACIPGCALASFAARLQSRCWHQQRSRRLM